MNDEIFKALSIAQKKYSKIKKELQEWGDEHTKAKLNDPKELGSSDLPNSEFNYELYEAVMVGMEEELETLDKILNILKNLL